MKFISIFWYIFSIAILCLLSYTFSIVFYNSTKLFFPILISVISGFFFFLGLFNIDKLSKLLYLNAASDDKNSGLKYIVLFVFVIAGTIASYTIFEERIEKALIKDGIVVKAKIKDGQHQFTQGFKRKTDKYFLDLYFKTEAGLECDFKAEVTSDIFNNAFQDLKVDVVYLEYEPSVYKVLLNDENIKRYRNIENKNLSLKEIDKFMALADNKKFRFLRTISGGWDTKVEDFGRIYFNLLKKEAIITFNENEKIVLYQSENIVDDKLFIPKTELVKKFKKPQSELDIIKYMNSIQVVESDNFELKNHNVEKTKVIIENGVITNYLIQKK